MLKKTVVYKDLDGNPVTEDFYFNLFDAEIAEMELSQDGGLSAYLNTIIESNDQRLILGTFKKILLGSVGRRSPDGKRFIKSEEITNEFLQSEAYSEIFMELLTNPDSASEFIKKVIPRALAGKLEETIKKQTISGEVSETKRPLEDYGREELLGMAQEDFDALVGTDPMKMDKRVLVIAMQRKSVKK